MGNFAENFNLGNRVRPPLANLEQAIGKKKTQFFGPDGPKFCILRESFDKTLLKSLKISHF